MDYMINTVICPANESISQLLVLKGVLMDIWTIKHRRILCIAFKGRKVHLMICEIWCFGYDAHIHLPL
jgi:fumarate reductase subunit D